MIVQTSRPWFWKKDFSRICENKISVESVQMILKLAIWNICLDQIHKIIHTWKLYMSKLILEK